MPTWQFPVADRYVSHHFMGRAIVQLTDDPDHVYVISDQALPRSVPDARQIVTEWRIACETAPE
jgi:hypothetical protein